jgi:Proteolysis_6 C-terminal
MGIFMLPSSYTYLIYRLARLPLLDSLFNRQDKALMCVNCNMFPVDAAICLICGTTVCLQSNCYIDEDYNNRGECMHTREYVFLFVFLSFSVISRFFLTLDRPLPGWG